MRPVVGIHEVQRERNTFLLYFEIQTRRLKQKCGHEVKQTYPADGGSDINDKLASPDGST